MAHAALREHNEKSTIVDSFEVPPGALQVCMVAEFRQGSFVPSCPRDKEVAHCKAKTKGKVVNCFHWLIGKSFIARVPLFLDHRMESHRTTLTLDKRQPF